MKQMREEIKQAEKYLEEILDLDKSLKKNFEAIKLEYPEADEGWINAMSLAVTLMETNGEAKFRQIGSGVEPEAFEIRVYCDYGS
jgi:hypothetical protein